MRIIELILTVIDAYAYTEFVVYNQQILSRFPPWCNHGASTIGRLSQSRKWRKDERRCCKISLVVNSILDGQT